MRILQVLSQINIKDFLVNNENVWITNMCFIAIFLQKLTIFNG